MPIVLALISYLLYASQAYLLEQKFSRYSVPAVQIELYVVMFLITAMFVLVIRVRHAPIDWPQGQILGRAVFARVVFIA